MNRLATLTTDTGVLSYEKAMQMPDGPNSTAHWPRQKTFLTSAQLEVFGLLVGQ